MTTTVTDVVKRLERFRGQPAVTLSTPGGDRATVLLHGAQVVSWIPAGGSEQLFLSERSDYGEGKTVRGGVPVVFPQFNRRGPDFSLPKHGLVRTRAWTLDEDEDGRLPGGGNDAATARFRLDDDAATRMLWPHRFSLTLTVTLGARQLDMALAVHNRGDDPFSFTAALHTYLQVADITEATVRGLNGVRYLDTVSNRGAVDVGPDLSFAAETDRIYFEVFEPLTLDVPQGGLEVAMEGFRDAVVWNPWEALCATLPDMLPDDYRRMLCIEAALIDKPMQLEGQGSWSGRQTLTAR